MEYFEYLEVVWYCLLFIWDYLLIIWEYSPWIAYALAFFTLVPKVWSRTVIGAKTELRDVKFHRCYGAERCCHPSEADDDVVRPRKKVLRRFAPKRDPTVEDKSQTAIHSQPPPQTQSAAAAAAAALLPTQPNHVNQIAKMFEGNARKVNRVTPIVTYEQSSGLLQSQQHHQSSDKAVTKKIVTDCDDLKYEKMTLRNLEERYFKPSPMGKPENIPENDENSADLLNRPLDSSSSSGIVIQRRRYPSTSPSPPPQASRPLSRPNSLKASIENIFALAGKNSLSPNGPVTSIEEILSQRRLSRPLSAYSISDLLGDSLPDESYIESFFGNLGNK